jgi:transcriptional regulator with XRE-family HTH domain
MEFAAAVGQILRKLRTDRGLTLHGVQELTGGSFKASALSGYERGERSISLEKFRELTGFYSVRADVAVAKILELLGEPVPTNVVDVTEPNVDVTDAEEVVASGRSG